MSETRAPIDYRSVAISNLPKYLWPRVLVAPLLLLLFLNVSCGPDSQAVEVDFSKTIQVDRPGIEDSKTRTLQVAVAAMVSPMETFIYYREILEYIGSKLGRSVELIQRKTYEEINEIFKKGHIDLGFICSGPYATGRERYGFELLATPRIHGSHFYQSYLIVNRTSPYRKLEDLKGRVFAFTDPNSNTGRLVPAYWLAQIGQRPETFFSKFIYTYSHDNSILAVARGLVDGASVDGLVWEYYRHRNKSFIANTRVIRKSEDYGIPPLVASTYLSRELKKRIKMILFNMHKDPEGKQILDELMVDRFIEPLEEWYDSIRAMKRKLAAIQ